MNVHFPESLLKICCLILGGIYRVRRSFLSKRIDGGVEADVVPTGEDLSMTIAFLATGVLLVPGMPLAIRAVFLIEPPNDGSSFFNAMSQTISMSLEYEPA